MLRIATLPALAIAALVAVLFLGNGAEAGQQVFSFLPGQIICTNDTTPENCYSIYRPPNSVPSKK